MRPGGPGLIEFRLLGTVSLLSTDGRELRSVLAQPKRVALLSYLAAASPRGFHRRDSLLPLFWPELDQEHARAALRQALHGLRHALGEGVIESRGSEDVRLSDEKVWCDAPAFDAALTGGRHADALELFRGDLLAGFFISGAPEFERWLEDERARLRRRAVEAAWNLAGTFRASGDMSLATHWARSAAALVRDDEAALRRLITLLGELGDRAGALQAYDAFARRLAEEYEATPTIETRTLIAAVRSRETTVATRPEAAQPMPARSEPEVLPGAEVRPRSQPHRASVAAFVTIAIVTVGAALVWGRDTPALDPTRIAVASFANRTGDTSLNALGQLAREEITRGLALTEVVEVADPTRANAGASGGSVPDAPEREAAGARVLAIATRSALAVWGSIDASGERIALAATIVDVQSGRLLRTLEPVTVDPLDPRPALMTLRDRIMVVVAEALDPRLGASASQSGGPPRYDAYTAFITGVGIWYDGRNGREALPHFKRAAELDSTFALPLIWAAWVHQTLGQCDSTEAMAGRLAALRLSRLEQMQIDRQLARCRGDLPAAYRFARSLVDARPHSEVWQEQLARDALNFERAREAVKILERLHPDRGALRGRASYYNWLTNAHHLLGEHDDELAVARRGRERFPGNLAVWRTEMLALSALGRGNEVAARLDEIDALSADPLRRKPTVLREIALDLAAHGDTVAARVALLRTLAWHAAQPPSEQATEFNRYERALAHYATGNGDSAAALVASFAGMHPNNDAYTGLAGLLAAQRGDGRAAAAATEQLAQVKGGNGRGTAAFWSACIAAQLGRRDAAVTLLRRALSEGYVFNGFFFLSTHLEPSFSTLRGYEPFELLVRPKG